MKVLLINPSDKGYLGNAGDRPPLGLTYIAASLLKKYHRVKIYDLNHHTQKQLYNFMQSFEPDFIGITFTSAQYSNALALNKYCKRFSTAKTIAGGVHPSIDPQSCLDFDYVLQGEGENTVCDIVEGKLSAKIIQGQEVNLSSLGLPARELLDMSKYNMNIDGVRTATLISSRGCPGHCIYCSRLFGHKYRFVPTRIVFLEMRTLYEEYNYNGFYFLDDTFTADEQRIKELADLIVEYGFKDKWQIRITTRANLISYNVVTNLSRMGVTIVSLGIEHADNNVLNLNAKAMTIEENQKAIELLHNFGIKVKGFFILNLPGATKETVNNTINWSKHYCDYADYYKLVAFPGTPIWKYPEKLGMRMLTKSYDIWEAGSKKDTNIENLNLPNAYVDKKIKEAQRIWTKN